MGTHFSDQELAHFKESTNDKGPSRFGNNAPTFPKPKVLPTPLLTKGQFAAMKRFNVPRSGPIPQEEVDRICAELPLPWLEIKVKDIGKSWYYNHTTKEKTWKRPMLK